MDPLWAWRQGVAVDAAKEPRPAGSSEQAKETGDATTATNSDIGREIEEAVEIDLRIMVHPKAITEDVTELIIDSIQRAFCDLDNPDHDCDLYAISWQIAHIGDDGMTPDERELEVYRERFGPLPDLVQERFGNGKDERYQKGKK